MSTHRTVISIGLTQTLAWASSYYLPAVLADSMSASLSVSYATVFLAFSVALGLSAFLGPSFGRAIDRWGGARVLPFSNLLFATGLTVLGFAQDAFWLWGGWLIMGMAMACGLYETAFASLVRLYGSAARPAITGVTLIAGFASTVGWPVSAWIEASWGWREVCFFWASLHLLLGTPLNALMIRAHIDPSPAPRVPPTEPARDPTSSRPPHASAPDLLQMLSVSIVFATTAFVSTALAAHWPTLLGSLGVGLTAAVALGALIGPAQVGARILEYGFLRRTHPLLSARLALAAHPIGAGLILTLGPAWAPAFALLHGAGNGIMTIVKGALPLALFGSAGYGARQGWIMLPARLSMALAPWLFGLVLTHWGRHAILLTLGLGMVSLLLLWSIRKS